MNLNIGETITINNSLYNKEKNYEVTGIDTDRMEYICIDENNPYSTFYFTNKYIDEFLITVNKPECF
jgi:hypothetical protein